jgi:2'-5' RNA ligase
MPYAITLLFDPPSAAAIAEMWHALDAAGIDTDRNRLGYAPHITLAIAPDDARLDRLEAAVGRLAARWTSLPVTLGGFGVFPRPVPVLWAAPVVTVDLLARQAEALAELALLAPHPHDAPGAWVPHVTLSAGLADPARALATLLPLWRPLGGMLDRIDLLRFRPVEIHARHALPA